MLVSVAWTKQSKGNADAIGIKGGTMTGKWSQPGVPHKGWNCIEVEDLGTVEAVCEMCETQEIRYVHYMRHEEHEEVLGVGCVCAQNMEHDYEGPRRRENALRNAAKRRSRWVERKWRTSRKGNPYLNTDGLNITIFHVRRMGWRARIIDRMTEEEKTSRRAYRTQDEAKLAAFDAMIILKEEHGWGC